MAPSAGGRPGDCQRSVTDESRCVRAGTRRVLPVTTTYGWLVLAFPLLGTIVIGAGYRKLPGSTAGCIGTGAIFLAFLAALATLISLQGHSSDHRQLVSSLWN